MIRILLADDHEVVRCGLRGLLGTQPGWQVCAEARTGREAVALAERLCPDVIILELALPELNGLEATRRLRRSLPETEVLVFTTHETEREIRLALLAGARGYLLKSDAAERLVVAVATLALHRPFFSTQISELLLHTFLQGGRGAEQAVSAGVLTSREREIVQLVAEGLCNNEAGEALGISVKTVETHRTAIMRKLKVGSLAGLVRYAVRNQIVEP